MADWTANSGFGTFDTAREPVFRSKREPHLRSDGQHPEARPEPRLKADPPLSKPGPESLRAEPRMPPEEVVPRLRPGAAALAQYNAALNGPLAKARFAVWAGGGALSLLLMGGVGVWGYKLVLREVMGLPVVVAETGPMRALPADPQGEIVPSQGLSVNAIPAAGTAAPPSDVLVLAPQAPGLAEEDLQVVQTNAEAGEVMPAAAPVVSAVAVDPLALVEAGSEPAALPIAESIPQPPVEPAAAPAEAAQVSPTTALSANAPMTLSEVIAVADSISTQAQASGPVAAATPTAEVTLVAAAPVEAVALTPAAPDVRSEATVTGTSAAPAVELASAAAATIPVTVPGVASSLRPAPRPTSLGIASTAPAATVASVTTAAPAEPASTAAAESATNASSIALTPDLPAGTNLVQLGAFDSPEIAAAEWDRLQGRFGEFLGGKERVIQETQSNGRTFYRLRAMGFGDRADARILCAALTAEDAACIPVTVD